MGHAILALIAAFAGVLWSRWRRGPARPGWSLRTELASASLRGLLGASRERGLAWLRSVSARTPALGHARREVRTEEVQANGVRACWFLPARGPTPERTILYLHGGGYVLGSPEGHAGLIANLVVRCRARVLAVDYRLAPEHPFPAAQDDAIAAYRFLLAEGVDPSRLAVAGDSAGGGLTVATLLQARAAGDALPGAAVLLCPWVDPTAEGGSLDANADVDFGDFALLDGWFRMALGDADPLDPRWTCARADLAAFPPLLVQWGGAEILRDQIEAFVERARAAGLEVETGFWEAMFHVWMTFDPLLPEAGEALRQVGAFLDKRLAS